jgi:hypothetical protein
MQAAARAPGRWRKPLRRTLWGAGIVLALVALAGLWVFRGALYNRYVRYPRQAAAWQAIRAQSEPVTETAGWNEYRGILHSHSHLSHDSDVAFEDILKALEIAELDFICMSDHADEGRADFSRQWRGLHGGKLFVPGFEMRHGYMPFGVASHVVLSNQMDPGVLARQVIDNGGVLFFAHPEEPRDWDRPELTGMEIYNIHVDFKRQQGLAAVLPDVMLNLNRYPDHIYHRISRRPADFLQRWDELNRTRHITGIAANDCHENVGFRGFFTTNGTLRVEDTSPETLREVQLNWLTRPLARLCFGRLEPNRQLFHVQLDPYERSARFVNTHILATELTEPALLDALRAGRVFVGFNVIANSRGFRWLARNGSATAVMGESMPLTEGTRLLALSPLPCRFSVFKNGTRVHQAEGRSAEWTPPGPGKYRVEAELSILGEWVPWVFANPIELK